MTGQPSRSTVCRNPGTGCQLTPRPLPETGVQAVSHTPVRMQTYQGILNHFTSIKFWKKKKKKNNK